MTDVKAAELLRREYECEWDYAYLDGCPTKEAFQYVIKMLENRAETKKQKIGARNETL